MTRPRSPRLTPNQSKKFEKAAVIPIVRHLAEQELLPKETLQCIPDQKDDENTTSTKVRGETTIFGLAAIYNVHDQGYGDWSVRLAIDPTAYGRENIDCSDERPKHMGRAYIFSNIRVDGDPKVHHHDPKDIYCAPDLVALVKDQLSDLP